MRLIGVDVGGSGIKAAIVDLQTGKVLDTRTRLPTPKPSTPAAVAATVAEIVRSLDCLGPVGITLPCIVHEGIAERAANIDSAWIGTDATQLFRSALGGRTVVILNDADAAGLAERRYGAAAGHRGTVLVLTFGTGIGSALLHDGRLVPNTEFGHLPVDGCIAEHVASASVRDAEGLSWESWGKRVNQYLELIETVVRLDLIVIGGGVSGKPDKWRHFIRAGVPVLPAGCSNDAGIIGAAMQAAELLLDGSESSF